MRLIESSVVIMPQEEGVKGMMKQIEAAGRTCYKSENLATEDSASKFVDMLVERNHTAPLEHGTIELKRIGNRSEISDFYRKYRNNPYSRAMIISTSPITDVCYVTTNLRVIYENNWVDDLKYWCKHNMFNRTTVRFICSIGIANEFVRHRAGSFCQESSRYCNYSRDKFGSEITFIKPYWCVTSEKEDIFEEMCKDSEMYYFTLLSNGCTPQEAREALPKAVKTELVMTCFNTDWEHFFELRRSSAAHPDAKKLADELYDLMHPKN